MNDDPCTCNFVGGPGPWHIEGCPAPGLLADLPRAPDGGTFAFHCRDATCSAAYRWVLTREGDVVTSWACDRHLPPALRELQCGRDTRVIVTMA